MLIPDWVCGWNMRTTTPMLGWWVIFHQTLIIIINSISYTRSQCRQSRANQSRIPILYRSLTLSLLIVYYSAVSMFVVCPRLMCLYIGVTQTLSLSSLADVLRKSYVSKQSCQRVILCYTLYLNLIWRHYTLWYKTLRWIVNLEASNRKTVLVYLNSYLYMRPVRVHDTLFYIH